MYRKILSVLLALCLTLTFAACNQTQPSVSNPPPTANSKAQTNFMTSLGFSVNAWPGVSPCQSNIIDDKILELKFEWDRRNTAYLRMMVDDGTSIEGLTDENFNTEETMELEGISVNLGFSSGGPMQASWVKNGYAFCLYMKEGESNRYEKSFRGWTEYFITDLVVEPDIAP